jgi:hypothetical protein
MANRSAVSVHMPRQVKSRGEAKPAPRAVNVINFRVAA